jgi:hypothetical protein
MGIKYYASDRAGNTSNPKIIKIVKDTEPPSITFTVENGFIDESDDTIVLGSNGAVVFTISDQYGLKEFRYSIDSGQEQVIQLQGKQQTVRITF